MKNERLEMLKEQMIHEERKLEVLKNEYLKQQEWVDEMQEEIEQLELKEKKVCPVCKKEYKGIGAISRKDNETEICSKCGEQEAIGAFLKMSYR